MATADLLLHPVRLRILKTLSGAHPLTTSQLRDRLPEIPPATMYRHVAVLVDAGVLEVVDEKRVRGTVERSYRVRPGQALIDPAARAAMTRENHRRAFTTFSASLLADFDRYLAHDGADPTSDGVVYQQAALWLTNDESTALVEEIRAAVTARIGNDRGGDRTRRFFSLVVVPDEPEPEPSPDTDQQPPG